MAAIEAAGMAIEFPLYHHNARSLKQRLLASAGSDYHGPAVTLSTQPWSALGRLPMLPAGCTPIWHDWAVPTAEPEPTASAAA